MSNQIEALAIGGHFELRKSTLEFRGLEKIVLLVAGKQFLDFLHRLGEYARNGQGSLADDLV